MSGGRSPSKFEAASSPTVVEDVVEACLGDGWTFLRVAKRFLRDTTANQLLLRCGDFFGLPPEVTEDGFRLFVVPDTPGTPSVISVAHGQFALPCSPPPRPHPPVPQAPPLPRMRAAILAEPKPRSP